MRDTTLGLALVGCGEVTRAKHLPALRRVPGIRVIALADLNTGRREHLGDEFRVPYRVATVEEAVAIPGVDAVGIAVPTASHAEVATAAIAAGKHVWIDKPLALSVEECLRIGAAAGRAPGVVMTGFHMRFHRLVGELRAVVTSGRLGSIESIRSVWNGPRKYVDLPEWRRHRASGGGALVETGVHHFDLWRFLLGTEVQEVFALARDGERDDENAVVTATLENGVLASAVLSERTSHEIEIEICGSAGRVRAALLRFEGLEFLHTNEAPGSTGPRLRRSIHLLRELPRGVFSMARGGEYRESYRAAWQHFLDAARGRVAANCGVLEGLRAVEVALAAVDSRLRHTSVPVWRAALPAPVEAVPEARNEPAPERQEALFSVVVPTWNRPAQLGELLRALCAQEYPLDRFEVVIVNDGGADVADVVAPFRDRLQIKLLESDHGGYAAARAKGAAIASGRWLVFTDDDCQPAPGWLRHLAMQCASTPECAAGGTVRNGMFGDLCSEATQLLLDFLAMHSHACGRNDFFTTNNVAFPKDKFDAIGGFHANWPVAGGEDRELCARWVEAGFRFVHVDNAIVFHYHRLDFFSFCRQHFNYGYGSHLFRARLASAGRQSPPLETAGFYLRLPLHAIRRYRPSTAAVLTVLLVTAQAANAMGFLWHLATDRMVALRGGAGPAHGRNRILP